MAKAATDAPQCCATYLVSFGQNPPNPVQQLSLPLSLEYLPRLRAVMSDVLGIEPGRAYLNLELAEALACDDCDRAEVILAMAKWFGLAVSYAEAEACESVADLLRVVAAKLVGPAQTPG